MSFQIQRVAVQRALQPFYTGALDGEFGPLTEAALHALGTATDSVPPQTSRVLDRSNPRAALVQELRKLVGKRETSRNRSPEIDALWQYTSYPDGAKNREPYCAATICACAARAARVESRLQGFPLPRSARVAGLLHWAQDPRNKCLVFTPDDLHQHPEAGDIAIFLPRLSHTALVAEDYHSGMLHTVEGNTNGAGARDGDGFWAKERPLALVGHFIRIAATA